MIVKELSNEQNRAFMAQAIQLAKENVASGKGGPFGAVIVQNGMVISTGVNNVTGGNDPTAHAEVQAIRAACQKLGTFMLTDCIIYTSCEPCPMCLSAIYWARMDKIYFAGTRQDAAAIGFDDDFLYHELQLPLEKRSLPIEYMDNTEVATAFKAWTDKQDKVAY